MSDLLGLDADGLPLFPPLPGGRVVPQAGARSLARVVAGLSTAVVTVRTDEVTAMVVFVDHRPAAGLALRGGRRVLGADALDEIADARVEEVTVTEVAPEVASVLASYFLPTELRALSAGLVAPEEFVHSLARPGQRGCLLVRAPEALGVVFLAGGRVVLACRQDGPAGGLEQVAPLFASPGATLWARLGSDPAAPAVEAEAVPAPAPAAAPAPATAPTPAPAWPAAASPLDVALAEVHEVLGPHAVRVEGLLRRAEPTLDGLRTAAESLRERRVRLLSRATMELVSDRVLAALEGAGPAFRR